MDQRQATSIENRNHTEESNWHSTNEKYELKIPPGGFTNQLNIVENRVK